MWVFGYGSLMGDGWEEKLGCVRRSLAVLEGYQRTFNKASTKNWGSKHAPCPTLNLERAEGAACKGIAFDFPDGREDEVRKYLAEREGKGFPLEGVTIRLEGNAEVLAYVPIYHGKHLISVAIGEAKAVMVRDATGTIGSCRNYVKEIVKLLARLDIDDPVVSEMWQAVKAEENFEKRKSQER